jgi:hypothetical protein
VSGATHPLGPRTPAGLRRIAAPRAVAVRTGAGGVPESVEGRALEAVLEDWVVEDRWWTEQPLRRRYLELVLTGGRNVVVFHDLEEGGGTPSADSAMREPRGRRQPPAPVQRGREGLSFRTRA